MGEPGAGCTDSGEFNEKNTFLQDNVVIHFHLLIAKILMVNLLGVTW